MVNPKWKGDLNGRTLHNSKPLEYQTKGDYQQVGAIYRRLEGLQPTLRRRYIIVVIDCSV